MSSNSFLVASLNFLCIPSCHLWKLSFTSFPLWSPFLSFPLWLLLMARTPKTRLNKSGNSGPSCLVPDLRGYAFSFAPLRMRLAVGLSYVVFVMLRYVLYVHVLEFYHRWVSNFGEFSCIYWDDHIDLILLVRWCGVSYWFICGYGRIPAPWDKAHVLMVYDPFNTLLAFIG